METPEAAEHLDEILDVPGIDEVHIGLNDLHLGYKMDFMFQLVADGTVERLCRKLRERGIFYGLRRRWQSSQRGYAACGIHNR